MKTGFELYLQEDLSDDDKIYCSIYLDEFYDKTISDSKCRYFGGIGGGYTSGLWRGRYGHELPYKELSKPIVFRRISKNQRKFACVYADTLVVKNDSFLDKSHPNYRDIEPDGNVPKMCVCPRHKGSLRVDWKSKPNFEFYKKFGNVKG